MRRYLWLIDCLVGLSVGFFGGALGLARYEGAGILALFLVGTVVILRVRDDEV